MKPRLHFIKPTRAFFITLVVILIPALLWFFLIKPSTVGLLTVDNTVHIIAHRGASAVAPENTLAAFRKSIELGADMIELDVRQTRDSQLVVIHDETVDRTTNGKGNVHEMSLDELRKLDAIGRRASAFPRQRIPLLNEIFDTLPDSIKLLIEMKESSDISPGIEARAVQLIHERKAERRVILKSFDDDVLDSLRRLAPDIPRLKIIVTQLPFVSIIIEHGITFGSVLDDSVKYLQHHWFGLTEAFIAEAHQRGYSVFAWDVDDETRMRELIAKGIDGIETDHPDLLKRILDQSVKP